MRKKIRLEPIVCSILLFLITGTMGIIAYQTDKAFVQNRLLPGWNDGEIIEEFPDPPPIVPGEEGNIVKKVSVGNKAGVPCFVRVFLKPSNSDIPMAFLYDGKEGYHTADWVLGEDGYYYYKYILEEGQNTSNLIDGVKIKADMELSEYWNHVKKVEILVYAETIQAKNSNTGMFWNSYEEAWEYYLTTIETEDAEV